MVLKWFKNSLLARIAFANSPAMSAVEWPLDTALALAVSGVPLEYSPLTRSLSCFGINAFVLSWTSADASIAMGIIALASLVSPRIAILRPGISRGGGSIVVPSGMWSGCRSTRSVRRRDRGLRMLRCASKEGPFASRIGINSAAVILEEGASLNT